MLPMKWWPVLLVLASSLLVGCNKEQIEDAVNAGVEQTTQVVEQTVETVKQETNQAGSMELATTPPVQAKACYAQLIVVGDGRPNVLRLASYKSTDLERFPSMKLDAQVKAGDLSELAGQTVQASVVAQPKADGPVWHSPTGSPANIKITSVDEKSMVCECSGAPVVNSDTGEESTVSGTFNALLE